MRLIRHLLLSEIRVGVLRAQLVRAEAELDQVRAEFREQGRILRDPPPPEDDWQDYSFRDYS